MNGNDLFSGSAANIQAWLSTFGVAFGLGAAAILVVALLKKRAWIHTPAAKWTLLVGLFALPVSAMLLGNAVGFHNTKQSCAECHTMAPWIADMKDPESETQAAKHYKNRWINEDQCYTCHTGYGLAGNVRAKLGGLSHVWHYYIAGVPEEIKISRPFPVDTCLHCHAQASSYLKVEQHVFEEFQPKILSGEMSCFECHTAPHPREQP